jgi:hypothetical protein
MCFERDPGTTVHTFSEKWHHNVATTQPYMSIGCSLHPPPAIYCCLPPADMLAQLRSAQEEAARLKKELSVLQQQQQVCVSVWGGMLHVACGHGK